MINFPSARIRFRERGRARSLPDLPSDGLRIICRSISRRIMFGFPGRRDWRHDPISIQLTERRIFICDFCSGVREEASLFVASIASLGNRAAISTRPMQPHLFISRSVALSRIYGAKCGRLNSPKLSTR